jgi:hypothetical protein
MAKLGELMHRRPNRLPVTGIPTAAIVVISLGPLLWRIVPEPVFAALGAIAGTLHRVPRSAITGVSS